MKKNIGLTKDAGWQFGLRKSVPVNLSEVWDFLFSEKGIKIWLKDANQEFSTFKQLSHLRTKWKLKSWKNEATLQLRIIANKDKTTIAFHIEKLLDEKQREEAKLYWTNILKAIIEQLNKNQHKEH